MFLIIFYAIVAIIFAIMAGRVIVRNDDRIVVVAIALIVLAFAFFSVSLSFMYKNTIGKIGRPVNLNEGIYQIVGRTKVKGWEKEIFVLANSEGHVRCITSEPLPAIVFVRSVKTDSGMKKLEPIDYPLTDPNSSGAK